jgi:hypothetical protein
VEELVSGGRIELENFIVLETQTIDRGENAGTLKDRKMPRHLQRVVVRGSKKLKMKINGDVP